jgi:septal ring factor EnvC (AmiA/AmiB activator)
MKKIALFLGVALMGMSLSAVASTTAVEPVASEIVSAKPAENIDKLLKDYEKAINDYAKAKKKTVTTNSKTSAQISKLRKQIDTLAQKLAKVEAHMTPAQLKRYNAANDKLASIEK